MRKKNGLSEKLPQKLSKKLALLAVSQGLSQAELARRIGMQASNLNLYLRGHKDVHSEIFLRILDGLGVDILDLVDQEIAKQNDMNIAQKATLGQTMESLARSLGAADREALISYSMKMAKVNLGAKASPHVRSLKAWMKAH